MSNWSKEEWANSWKGDILTDDGSEIISDNEINLKVSGLEKKLQENTEKILDKQSGIIELNSKIDPLNSQIKNLKNQKTVLLSKFNEELLNIIYH